ncbi:hypothetical protein EV424DRAFT_1541972 [Suillus variegatus]|nr:hypothetical protein EV424DRAFT_1541972 [Suillus variegatus]
MTQSTYTSCPSSLLLLAEAFKFNLELTAAELELIEYALRQVDGNHEALPLLERVQYMRTLPVGTPLGLPSMDDSLSSKDGMFLSVEKSFTKCHKFSAFVEDFFRQSLASDDGESVDDYFFQGLSANETRLDTEAFEEEDIDVIPDNGNGDEELRGCRHQHLVASRKLHQPNQHPYAPPRGPILPREPINMRLPGPDPTCPRNGRCLHAAQIWQVQATSIQSASFITSDALIATLATSHVESTASHLDVRAWVDNTLSYLKQQDSVQLGVGSKLYNNILTTFGELFEWIEMVMKEFLPEEYEVLVELGQNLPGGECSLVAPFLSLVLNLNVTTKGH